jgi:hypothetical protein
MLDSVREALRDRQRQRQAQDSMTDSVAIESHRQSLESNLTMGIVFIVQLDVDMESFQEFSK